MGAAIAQWICLRLPSCRPVFESQAHHLSFYHLLSNLCYICHVKRTKINKKRPGLAHLKKLILYIVDGKKVFNNWMIYGTMNILEMKTCSGMDLERAPKYSSLCK